ncbi:uncharacterized protein [Elaeis guineensis]|uniref:Uncharacterized protein LOC105053879 isoform X2 n=1 Tax=Elaeis guineensis var. tenera TaxID=51953 RepID=A0A6I9S4Z4_ELAGV|nr:uncharacterized protein LOC105053879 isoform X2 [Elaeis guineensis]
MADFIVFWLHSIRSCLMCEITNTFHGRKWPSTIERLWSLVMWVHSPLPPTQALSVRANRSRTDMEAFVVCEGFWHASCNIILPFDLNGLWCPKKERNSCCKLS